MVQKNDSIKNGLKKWFNRKWFKIMVQKKRLKKMVQQKKGSKKGF